ncbi:MAG: xylulose kinase [Propionibacteriaceae bacterium]|jgi:xylulokinase|nr:xylulose kinase [Propionibacteriaceae bacterium]
MNAQSPVILALDSSTTSTKAIAFDLDGRAVVEARRDYPRSQPQPGWQEQDAEDWWRAAQAAIRDVAAACAAGRRDILALCLTHQRESFVLLDDRDRPVRPAILWLDTRAGEQIERVGSDFIHGLSGKPPSTTPSLYKLIWLAEREPDALARASHIVEVHGFLTHRLTGRWLTSWATADPMALLDMRDFTYAPALLATAGVEAGQLSELTAPGRVMAPVAAAVARDLGLPPDLPVVAGAGDGQAAGLGAHVTGADRAYLSLGTSMTMGVHSDDYLYSRAFRTLASPMAGGYTLEALLSSGALCVAWFRDRLSGLDPADGPIEPRLERLAETVPAGARGLRFLPYLTSAETPFWDAKARGAFVGLADTHGLPELYRAVLEGLALEERLTLRRLEKATGVKVARLSVMGGASRSKLFTQIIADVLQRPLDICAETETTCLGAAILGAAAVGADGEHSVQATAARMSHVARTVEPDAGLKGVYRLAAKAHQMLYPALKQVFPLLSELAAGGADGRDAGGEQRSDEL